MKMDYKNCGKIGFVASCFDLLHAGHVVMLEEAKRHCNYLIVGLQIDSSVDRPEKKRSPVQSIIERQIQISAVKYVDDVVIYSTESDLEDLLKILPIKVRFLGEEYKELDFTGRDICEEKGIEFVFNKRDHSFSSTELKQRTFNGEIERRRKLEEK